MLNYIRIQNYKSIKDATFNLKDVNLLIGANNSGKTNFMKALTFFGDMYAGILDIPTIESHFYGFDGSNEMSFTLLKAQEDVDYFFKITIKVIGKELYFLECAGHKVGKINVDIIDIKNIETLEKELSSYTYYFNGFKRNAIFRVKGIENISEEIREKIQNEGLVCFSFENVNPNPQYNIINMGLHLLPLQTFKNESSYYYEPIFEEIKKEFLNIKIYKANIASLLLPGQISNDNFVKADCSNLVSFLDEMNNNYADNYDKINAELKRCVGEITKVSTPTIKGTGDAINTVLGKKLRFLDKSKQMIWVEDVSDGVLYFLSLLCILNQPNPPKLLLLEEPEIGIHPIRLREIIDYIFELADEKGVQVILTSHSSFVIDEFKDLPENIFIFDKRDGLTTVKNLQTDIIEPEDVVRKEKGVPPSDHLSNISSHWTVGLFGGIPFYEAV